MQTIIPDPQRNDIMVDTHRITGAARELGGKVQGAIGDLTGSNRHSVGGRIHEAEGAAENLYGQARDTEGEVADHVMEAARHVGGRIRHAVGQFADRETVKHRLDRARGAVEAHFHDAEGGVRNVAHDARDHAANLHRNGGRYLQEGRVKVAHRIAEQPIGTLLLAGLLGYGLSLLVHGRR